LRGLSFGELSASCSSLAKGCDKQRLLDEMVAFTQLADYYKTKAGVESGKSLQDAAKLLQEKRGQKMSNLKGTKTEKI
jgi:hypothetical protein